MSRPARWHRIASLQTGTTAGSVRIVFAAEPGTEPEIRRRIELALSGQWPLPEGLIPAWQLCGSQASQITPGEAGHAGRLIRA
jgi:hypothetical protein